MFDLIGKKGIVIGVANEASIATGVVRAIVEAGGEVVATYLNDKAYRFAAPAIKDLAGVDLVKFDATEPYAVKHLFEAATALLESDHIDFVVHSMAWAPLDDLRADVKDVSRKGFAEAADLSVATLFEVAREAEFYMPPEGGTIVTMTYGGSTRAIPGYGLMGPLKAALEASVRALAVELGARNIRVHAVSPGPIVTRAASALTGFNELTDDARERSPLRRLVTVDEVGALTAFLAMDVAAGMTGGVHFVDAGRNIVG